MSRTQYKGGRLRPQPPSLSPIILFDTETTGLSPSKNHLIEIALMELPLTASHVTPSFSSLIHPPQHQPRSASRVHGITNQMMQDAPTFIDVWSGVLEYIEELCHNRGRPLLVAHNVAFDVGFLKEELKRNGLEMPDWDFACSFRDVANVMYERGNSLKGLGERLGVVNEEEHRALSDIKALGEVLEKIEGVLRERNGGRWRQKGGYVREMLERGAAKRRGENVEMTDIREGEQRNVYVTPTGVFWHSRRECELLDLARVIRRVDDVPVGKIGCYKCCGELEVDGDESGRDGCPSAGKGKGSPKGTVGKKKVPSKPTRSSPRQRT